jgi:hypothetical protein
MPWEFFEVEIKFQINWRVRSEKSELQFDEQILLGDFNDTQYYHGHHNIYLPKIKKFCVDIYPLSLSL